MLKESLSIGNTTLRANGIRGKAVQTANYISPEHRQPLPYPSGDWYLRQTFVPAIGEDETVICNTLIDGLLPFYKNTGLIPDNSRIIEVYPSEDKKSVYGYPATDPLEVLKDQVEFEDHENQLTLIPTFNNNEINNQASKLGLKSIDRALSITTNNKSNLREVAKRYGIQMLPGKVLQTWEDLDSVINASWNTEKGMWMKFPTGSGGDLVSKIPHTRDLTLLKEGYYKLIRAVMQSFNEAEFEATLDQFWSEGILSPTGLPLAIEADAGLLGEVLINGSTQFVTNKTKRIDILGHFSQMTTESGEYLGNEPITITNQVSDLIQDQVLRVGAYNMHENNYYGIQGIDWFLIQSQDRNLQVTVTELNSRPTANTPPLIIAEKLSAPHWINTNFYTRRDISSFADFEEIIGSDLVWGKPESSGMVIPQAFRTMVRRKDIIPSPNFKALILGRDPRHCRELMEKMKDQGIMFAPGK